MNIISTHNLTKYYGKSRGIIDLNLELPEGEIFGFIGPNGAGKSTTIRTLLGLIKPTSGSARIFDKDIIKEKESILSDIGYMPSEAMFYSGIRVGDIIRMSASLHKRDCSARAKELCERLELDVKKKIDELSLGNRKKVSIVCALQHRRLLPPVHRHLRRTANVPTPVRKKCSDGRKRSVKLFWRNATRTEPLFSCPPMFYRRFPAIAAVPPLSGKGN